MGNALGDGRNIQAEPDLDVQGDDQLAALLRDGDTLRRQTAGAQGAAYNAFGRGLTHGGNAVALLGGLLHQAGEVVVRQGDMSIGIDLGDHLRSSFTGLAAAKAVAARYESLAIIHLFSPLEQRFQRNLFCGADLTFHSQSLQTKRIYWLQKYDNIAKGVQFKA